MEIKTIKEIRIESQVHTKGIMTILPDLSQEDTKWVKVEDVKNIFKYVDYNDNKSMINAIYTLMYELDKELK